MALPLLGAFLTASVGALAKRALIALGVGTITYAGLDTAFDAAKHQVINNYGQLQGSAAAIADLAGVGAALGIILGALAARVSLAVVSRLAKVL